MSHFAKSALSKVVQYLSKINVKIQIMIPWDGEN